MKRRAGDETRRIRLGISPCPNDTFTFHALLHEIVEPCGFVIDTIVEDIETLNHLALAGEIDVTKVSFHAFGQVRNNYELLDSGSALGRGCGPMVVTRPDRRPEDLPAARIAVPGRWTSAALLLRLHQPRIDPEKMVILPFERILEAVEHGEVDAGVIIHESRFTYRAHGLECLVDLGRWWEDTESLPLPLGGIAAHRRLGHDTIRRFDAALRKSIEHARAHPDDSRDFVRHHAQEMSEAVLEAHIDLYVNDFTVELGEEGRRAVGRLLERAEEADILARRRA